MINAGRGIFRLLFFEIITFQSLAIGRISPPQVDLSKSLAVDFIRINFDVDINFF